MKYACGGCVVLSRPSSTRPGAVRQASGVEVGVSVGGEGVNVNVGSGSGVGGIRVGVGKGWLDGEQATSPARSVSRIVVCNVA